MQDTENSSMSQQELSEVHRLRREKLAELQRNGQDPYQVTKYEVSAHSRQVIENFEQMEGQEVALAGRLMSKRVMGKASFANIQDLKGNRMNRGRFRSMSAGMRLETSPMHSSRR